jgi:hypothetical protein
LRLATAVAVVRFFLSIFAGSWSCTISILIDNAFESFSENIGVIKVSLSKSGDAAMISIEDNGKGIPKDLIPHLMTKGGTYGKAMGNGLGLSFVREYMANVGGTWAIEALNPGTSVKLFLPISSPPAWLAETLEITHNSKIVVLDAEPSMHQAWRSRIANSSPNWARPEILYASSPKELRSIVGSLFSDLAEATYLVDYQLGAHSETGLDMIVELGLADAALLVTSSYDDPMVIANCERLAIKILPKSLSSRIPVMFHTKQA